MNLEELNDLDLRDINFSAVGDWPAAGKAVVLAIVVLIVFVGGYFFVVQDQLKTLDQAQATEITLKNKFKRKQPLAANLEAYQMQLALMHKKFDALLKQLPSKTEIDDLLADISQTARENGLVQNLFRPQPEVSKQFYIVKPIKMAYTGSWEQIAKFVSDVSSLPRIVTLSNFTLKPVDKSGSGAKLSFKVTAETYRYRSGLNDFIAKGGK